MFLVLYNEAIFLENYLFGPFELTLESYFTKIVHILCFVLIIITVGNKIRLTHINAYFLK